MTDIYTAQRLTTDTQYYYRFKRLLTNKIYNIKRMIQKETVCKELRLKLN